MDQKKTIPFIQFTDEGIKVSFNVLGKKEGDMYSWYVPAYDIYFSSPTEEIGRKRAKSAVMSFFNYWTKEQSFKNFILEIHKLGFRASENHELTVKKLIDKQHIKAKFKSAGKTPPSFQEATVSQGEMTVAM
jgi:hypothetical protein